jgi:hypothetical protein
MAKVNVKTKQPPVKTHEGAPAARVNNYLMLRRSVCSCLLWEDTFYESGKEIASRIAELVPTVTPADVRNLAIQARVAYKLRHVPLLLAREMVRHTTHKPLVAPLLGEIIQRPDELGEFLSMYWKGRKGNKRPPIAAQVKKGLARAVTKFDPYQLAKYNRDADVSLRDVMFLCHPKPKDEAMASLWKTLVDKTIASANTWERNLSKGEGKKEEADKRAVWEKMLKENKLGALALLRNLRNMQEAHVNRNLIREALIKMKTERVLPFRFITAARYAPDYEPELEKAMFKCLKDHPKLSGKTVLAVDVSGSMTDKLSGKSELERIDAAAALAILLREICEDITVTRFNTQHSKIPPRRGFALRDAIGHASGGTDIGGAVDFANRIGYDRLIMITDEQSHTRVGNPVGKLGYMVNVGSNKNGVGYGAWNHIDGFSEAIVDWMVEFENLR